MIRKGENIIVNNARFCKSLYSKAIGLRFRKKPRDTGIVFIFDTPQKVMMDMWFVFYPIDVIFLDKDKKIIEIKEDFRPWTFYSSKQESCYIIELEAGVVKKNRIMIGDIFSLE